MILRTSPRDLPARVLLFVVFLCCCLPALAAGTTGTAEIRPPAVDKGLHVMTFNIRVGTAHDGPDRWQVRKDRLIQVMRHHPAEVIGLQEALVDQLDDLRTAFPHYRFLGVAKDGLTGGEFTAVMYDSRRLEVLQSDTFWLSETPNVPGSKHWGNKFERICTWARFHDLKTGGSFYFFNTHLDHQSQPSREKGTELILRRIRNRAPKDPVILTGDLNAREKNPVNQMIRRAEFRDTFRVLHPDTVEAGTTNGFREKRGPHKIDFIYADPSWSVLESDILTDKVDGRWPSDHLPVTATVSVSVSR